MYFENFATWLNNLFTDIEQDVFVTVFMSQGHSKKIGELLRKTNKSASVFYAKHLTLRIFNINRITVLAYIKSNDAF